ncbi:MAG TPA: DNRLRE domain-containing protein, partial [Dermatophilaceae bacterium]|nr:DNRLRE domain-containing protein [Dermatophilaceae bacterium]
MRGRALLCLLLVMSLAWGAVPASGAESTTSASSDAEVFQADEVAREPAPAVNDAAADQPAPAPTGERVELVERRTASSATFQLPDGSFELVRSAAPLHYRDGEGVWQRIDTSLVPAQRDGVAGWRNAAGGVEVFLPERVSAAAGVRLATAGHEIDMRMVDGDGRPAALTAAPVAAASAARAEVAYATPFAGVGVEYASVPTGVKETVVLDGPAAGSVFRFALDLSAGLSVDTVDGQAVVVDAGGTVVAEFGRAFMIDSSGDAVAGYSDAVTLTVAEQSAGRALLELAADARWLEDPARVFPVRIDPTLTVPDIEGVTDSYIAQGSPSSNYGSADTLLVARSSAGEETRALVRWNEDPTEWFSEPVVVKEALLRLWTVADANPDAIPAVGVHRLTQGFNSAEATWTHRSAADAWTTAGGSIDADAEYVNTDVSEAAAGWAEFAVSELAQDWADGEVAYQGLLVDWADTAAGSVQFASNSYADSSKRPQLVINYSPLIGVRDTWRYQQIDLTDRRQALVNLASGNLTVRETDVNIAGTGMPFTVERAYNSRWYSTRGMGRNWSMWPQDTAPMRTGYADAKMWEGGPAGVVMFFKQPDGTWRSPSGVDATLTMDGNDEIVTDNDSGTAMRFGSYDALESITDRNGNTILAHHTSDPTGSFRYHSSFTDTQGRTITVDAVDNKQITKVTDPAGREHVYTYDTTGYAPVLTGYTDPAGKSTTYTYDTTGDIGDLEAITDSEGNVTRFVTTSGGRIAQIVRVTDPATGTGPTWEFDYSVPWQTTVTDPNGHDTTYSYDRRGRITKVVDALGHEQATTYTAGSNVASYTDRIGGTSTLNSYTSDGLDNLVSTQTPTGAATTFGYTDPDNPYAPSTMTTPQGNSVVYDYDAAGNLATITDAQSQCVGGCATSIVRNPDGTVASTTDARGNTTTFGYDPYGNQTSIDPPGIGTTTVGYDGLSRPTSVTDGNNHTTTIGYDALDRPTLVTYHDASQVTRT